MSSQLKAEDFRRVLAEKLSSYGSRPLMRVALQGNRNHPETLSGVDLLNRSRALAGRHASGGVTLLLLPHSVELFLLHIGLTLLGDQPAILAWPTTRIDPEKYQTNLLHQLQNLPAARLITLPRLACNLGPHLPFPVVGCEVEGAALFERAFELKFRANAPPEGSHKTSVPPDRDTIFLQFSGGTTGAQKCVMVTASMLVSQLQNMRERLDFNTTRQDSVVSWLPMYHDMGLIACLWLPLWFGASSLHFSAADWLLNPGLLFEHIERFEGTFCWLPNFAFAYLAEQSERITGSFDASKMRAWINCSEPVRHRSMSIFAEKFRDWGVRTESLQACYAMAETVFAITQTELGIAPPRFQKDRVRDANNSSRNISFDILDDVYTSSGRVLSGAQVRILDGSGRACGEAEPGQIQVHSDSLFSGYWTGEGIVRGSLSADGWHSTGDYGFIASGELYVIGRLKDIVIVGGQNVFPEDVELVVGHVPGIYSGRVVAFGIPDEHYDTESLVVVAEMRGPFDDRLARPLERKAREAILSSVGVAARFVRIVSERWIVKSTAGKISRRETRERFLKDLNAPKEPTSVSEVH